MRRELRLPVVEVERRFLLLGVGPKLSSFDQLGVSVEDAFQATRSASSFLVSAIALAGFRPFGQTLAQFMMVWQR